MENEFSLLIPLLKLSGFGLSLILAFLLTYGVTKSTQSSYIENKNAVYGFKFNEEMKEFGFQDSMRINYINGKEIDRVSDIIKKILLEGGDVVVSVELNGVEQEIIISDSEKSELIKNPRSIPITPIMTNGVTKVKETITNHGFEDVLNDFGDLWKQAIYLINPLSEAKNSMGGFVTISDIKDLQGYFIILSLDLIIIVILNILPLPGFTIGNFIVSVIETIRERLYDKKKKRIIGWVSILLVISLLIIGII